MKNELLNFFFILHESLQKSKEKRGNIDKRNPKRLTILNLFFKPLNNSAKTANQFLMKWIPEHFLQQRLVGRRCPNSKKLKEKNFSVHDCITSKIVNNAVLL